MSRPARTRASRLSVICRFGRTVCVSILTYFGSATVSAAPTISRQPADTDVVAGQNATLTVAAAGTGALSYQWRRSGFAVPGATSDTFVLPRVSRGAAGWYDVMVSDSSGSTKSSIARLVVAPRAYPGTVATDRSTDLQLEVENANVYAIAALPDGGFVAGGDFASVNGTRRSMVVRFNADKSLDPDFVPPHIDGNEIRALAVQADGKVLAGGDIRSVGSHVMSGVVRLNTDGSLDDSFAPAMSANDYVYDLIIQPDGKILVGAFSSTALCRRLNPDGSLDKNILVASSGSVRALARQPDGKIIAGGDFSAGTGAALRHQVARFNSDGTIDPAFDAGSCDGTVSAVVVNPADGSVFLGGNFTHVGGSPEGGLVKLTTTGAVVPTFSVTVSSGSPYYTPVNALVLQLDGSLVMGGFISTVNGQYRNEMARVGSDGTLDPVYGSGLQVLWMNALALLPNGDVLGGSFEAPHMTVARVTPAGAIDRDLLFTSRSAGRVTAVVPLPNGQYMVFGTFNDSRGNAANHCLRLNADGTIDASYISKFDGRFIDAGVALPDGRIVAHGTFAGTAGADQGAIGILAADGSVDSSFLAEDGPVLPGAFSPLPPNALAITPDGHIVVVGSGRNTIGISSAGVAEYNADGSLVSTFANGAFFDALVEGVTPQVDGKLVVSGQFTNYRGISCGSVARLNADGTLDTAFAANGHFLAAGRMVIDSKGRIVVNGRWVAPGDAPPGTLVRLNPDGTRDKTFNAQQVGNVEGLVVQEDGKILVFQMPSSTAVPSDIMFRLHDDGSVDHSLRVAVANPPTISFDQTAVFLRDDGQILYADGALGDCSVWSTTPAAAPVINSAPADQIVAPGGAATLSVQATSVPPVEYQWYLNGTAIRGATRSTYTIPALGPTDTGLYSVTVTSGLGTVSTTPVMVNAPKDSRGHLVNLSIRATTGTGDDRLIVGVVLGGAGTGGNKPLLFRGVGPSLAAYGVSGYLDDPMLELYDSTGTLIDRNDDWNGVFNFASVGAFPFSGPAPKDAAVYNPYATNGVQTMHVFGKNNASGIVLAEVYDATVADDFTALTPRFINGSARMQVGVGDNALILGFVIGGTTNERLLVRAVGPTLGAPPFNIGGVLSDPQLEIYAANGVRVAENDNWGDNGAAPSLKTTFNTVGAFGLSSADSKDAALTVTLAPGLYSAVVRGVGDTTGVAIVELYELP